MEQNKINSIADHIASQCDSEQEVNELLSHLSLVNWKDVLEAKAYENSLRPCQLCREWKVCTTFSSVLDRDCRGLKFPR